MRSYALVPVAGKMSAHTKKTKIDNECVFLTGLGASFLKVAAHKKTVETGLKCA